MLIPRKHISPGQTGFVGHPAWPLRPEKETSTGVRVGSGRCAGRGREREVGHLENFLFAKNKC